VLVSFKRTQICGQAVTSKSDGDGSFSTAYSELPNGFPVDVRHRLNWLFITLERPSTMDKCRIRSFIVRSRRQRPRPEIWNPTSAWAPERNRRVRKLLGFCEPVRIVLTATGCPRDQL